MFYTFHNGICCRYSLTVRLLLLVLLLCPLTGACSGTSEQHDMPEERTNEATISDTMGTKRNSTSPATVALLENPFLSDRNQTRKLESYIARINTDFTVEAAPIENIHEAGLSDTIYTINFGSSSLELYAPTQTGELLLQVADIRSNALTLRNNMRVGMSQAELMTKLKNYDVRILQTNTEIVATNREGAPTSLRFFLKNGKVSRIRYEGYVD
ncbi:hypothetical protein [Pontibacter vulgaris]|uniref:hypothetical protein n=1 Tax=Pontibacter vulgaris TaxID=2905679 RepID=UPI001FA74276|nr:hypothetical protein [Pontibacter vulgaris]